MKKRYINKLDRTYSLILFLVGLSVFIWGQIPNWNKFLGGLFMFSSLIHFIGTIKEEILIELKEKENDRI